MLILHKKQLTVKPLTLIKKTPISIVMLIDKKIQFEKSSVIDILEKKFFKDMQI